MKLKIDKLVLFNYKTLINELFSKIPMLMSEMTSLKVVGEHDVTSKMDIESNCEKLFDEMFECVLLFNKKSYKDKDFGEIQ
eukprot:CAMPEP_0116978174 /NCGR_PEP_ID=MMETSP0467-20121206/57611_1 /TAXON_ID=283647 /ORGANISM="Mesodinium pulex, Strain SPMC105" /LENGTH=80 /DNA_ID=CAMNT_0004671467 /DNA_START=1379 /DNA_END=1618 /DNA_ORIENTATION=-